MEKVDAEKMFAAVEAEYRDFPNPDNDPILAFEARGAKVIAALITFIAQENNERSTPATIIINGLMAIASIPMDTICEHLAPEIRESAKHFALQSLAGYLGGGATLHTEPIDIPTKDVGDA